MIYDDEYVPEVPGTRMTNKDIMAIPDWQHKQCGYCGTWMWMNHLEPCPVPRGAEAVWVVTNKA